MTPRAGGQHTPPSMRPAALGKPLLWEGGKERPTSPSSFPGTSRGSQPSPKPAGALLSLHKSPDKKKGWVPSRRRNPQAHLPSTSWPSLNTGQKTSPGVWLARAFTLPRADILLDAAAYQLTLPPASVLDPSPPPIDAPPPGHIKGGLTQEASPNGAA